MQDLTPLMTPLTPLMTPPTASYWLELPKLERVVIHRHMRHYSHTEEQLKALLAARRQTDMHTR
jgi:hypothetical protein